MRIAIIAAPGVPIPPKGAGGPEVFIDVEARALLDAGHEVTLVTTGDSTCPVPKLWTIDDTNDIEEGAASYELQHVLFAYNNLPEVDIVHDHTLSGLIYSKQFPSLQVVHTNHGPFVPVLNSIYWEVVDRIPLIAISRSHAQQAGELPISRVIHHGLDLDNFPVGGGGDYFLFIGRMNPQKGIKQAIDAAREAGVPLKIAARVTKPAEHDYLRDVIQPLLGNDVEFLGEIGGRGKLEVIGAAKAVLDPIQWEEPFGLVMIEALACGTPVIVSPRGAAPEIITDGETGFLCPDQASLVNAIGKIDEIDRGVCRKHAEEHFSAERLANDHTAFFQDVLATR